MQLQVYVQDGSLFAEVPSLLTTPTDQMYMQATMLKMLVEELESCTSTTGEVDVHGETKFVRRITCPIQDALVILYKWVRKKEDTTLTTEYLPDSTPERKRARLADVPQNPLNYAAGMLSPQDQLNLFAAGVRGTKVFAPGTVSDKILSLRKTASAGWFRRIFERDDIFARVQRGAQSDDNGARAQRGAQANHKRFEATHKAALPTQATKEGLLRFLKACPNLENLTLSGCAAVDDEVVNAITRRNLHTLDLTNCERITDSGVKSLARCTKLTNLDLSKCNVSDDAVSHLVRGFDKVEALYEHGLAPDESEYSGCKQLETLVLDGIEWRTNVSDTALIAIGEECPRLTTLFAWDCHSVTDAGVIALAQGCPLLHRFATNRCENLYAGIGALQTLKLTHLKLGRCALTSMWVAPLLKKLALMDCPNLAEVFAIARATGLTSLDLTNSPRVTDADMSLIAKKCPRLSDLNLDGCNLISDTTLVALGEHCPQLSLLRLWDLGAGVSDAGIIKLAEGCTQLSTFTLGNCERLTAVAGYQLGKLPLKVLELMRYTHQLDVNEMLGFVDLDGTIQPYLTELRLIDCRRLRYVDGISFAPQLTWLQLKNCRVVRDRHIRAIARGCPRLLHLDVAYCPRVKKGIKAVAQHCPDLTTLYVERTGVGDEQMHALIQCRRLTDLDLTLCNITDAAAFSIAQMPLRRLVLNNTSITDAFVGAVAQGCRALETLLVANSAITNVGFAAIGRQCRNLQYLNLQGAHVTSAGLRAFAEWEFPSFKYLNISYCSKIFADAVEAVQLDTGWEIRSEGIADIREDSSDSEGEDEEDGIWEV